MQTETNAPPSRANDATLSTAAVLCCLGAVYFNALGWLLAIVGIVLLYRSPMRSRTKWLLAAGALVPKIAFLIISRAEAPRGLSFEFDPWTLATSTSIWFWSLLLIGFGERAIAASRRPPALLPGGVVPMAHPGRNRGLVALGLVFIAVGAMILLGPFDSYQRIDDAGGGRWALHHAVRGNVATFARGEVALVECRENHASRGASSYSVIVRLTDGRSFSVTTRSQNPFEEMRRFVATADLAPGRARYVPYHEPAWSNGGGFTLKDYVGAFEYADKSERRRIEFRLDGDRLAGKETVTEAGNDPYVRTLNNIKVSDTGETWFAMATRAEARDLPGDRMRFSFQWSSDAETARLTKAGFEVGPRRYARR